MNDIRTLLGEADPVRHEAGLASDVVAEMRRTMLAATHATPRRPPLWSRQLAMAAGLAGLIVAGVVAASKVPVAPSSDDVSRASAAAPARHTQLQFSTPGGTRIIWTLDPDFQLREATR